MPEELASLWAIPFKNIHWAFTHLDTQGEGMGSRAGHGYLFLFAILFNPVLMVIGLFLGMGALEIITGFLNATFPQVLADVNQNSMTGIFKIFAFCCIYLFINLTLVNLCSQFINIVPDQVTSWIGGQFQNHLGRNAEDQVGGKFGLAKSNFSGGSMDRAGDKLGGMLDKAIKAKGGGDGGTKAVNQQGDS